MAQALALRREVLGEQHPQTLTSMNNLALLYRSQGRYGEAEPLYAQALALRREVLGEQHPDTLTSMNNLALLYQSQGRYGEAEPLFAEGGLALRREVLGEQHPDTLASMNNLAGLYMSQGRYGEAELILAQALALRREVLGEQHPDTISSGLNSTFNLAALGKAGEAAKLLRQLQPRLLEWLGAELYASQDVARRGSIIVSQSTFQHLAVSLAVAFPAEPAAQGLAALAMLRFKGLLAEEEAYLAHLGRGSEDPRIRQAADALKAKRQELAAAYHGGAAADRFEALLRETNEAEVALGRVSRVYENQLQVTRASLEDACDTAHKG